MHPQAEMQQGLLIFCLSFISQKYRIGGPYNKIIIIFCAETCQKIALQILIYSGKADLRLVRVGEECSTQTCAGQCSRVRADVQQNNLNPGLITDVKPAKHHKEG